MNHPSDIPDFWHEMWTSNHIGFHQNEVSPFLQKYWTQSNGSVFVPLCGKTKDMVWLAENNHDVVGVEFNEIAVRDFFQENNLHEYQREQQEQSAVYHHSKYKIYCGDFFNLPTLDTKYIFDRAALVALSQELRKRYVEKLQQIVPQCVEILLITYEYPQQQMPGPPFSISQEMVHELYKGKHVEKLEERDVLQILPKFAERLSFMKECVYRIHC